MFTIRKLYRNLINSFQGLKAMGKGHSFLLELLLGVPIFFILALSGLPFALLAILCLSFFLLLALEILNTAIEELCDMVCNEYSLPVKRIKDMASAAVFVMLTFTLAFGGFLMYLWVCG